VVDDGAKAALIKGKSLLPAGVKNVDGTFSRGDTVSIVGTDGTEIARGLVAHDAADAKRIIGLKSADVQKLLGADCRDEIIHRDDLVMMGQDKS
jgi:glutamate 5-kinase